MDKPPLIDDLLPDLPDEDSSPAGMPCGHSIALAFMLQHLGWLYKYVVELIEIDRAVPQERRIFPHEIVYKTIVTNILDTICCLSSVALGEDDDWFANMKSITNTEDTNNEVQERLRGRSATMREEFVAFANEMLKKAIMDAFLEAVPATEVKH